MNTSSFFKPYYNNAELNCILIMNCEGVILNVNQAFTNNFGYSNDDIKGHSFSQLFTERDREKNRPQLELETVVATGQAQDENYIIDKKGHAIWALGESLLVSNEEGEKYIVKDIINLQAKKQLQLFLIETEELLERIFESSKDIPMMVLDGSMKVVKANPAFLSFFEINDAPLSGSRLSDLHQPFWTSEAIRKDISNILVTNQPLRHREYWLETKSGEKKKVKSDSRIIDGQAGQGRKIFTMMEDVTPQEKVTVKL